MLADTHISSLGYLCFDPSFCLPTLPIKNVKCKGQRIALKALWFEWTLESLAISGAVAKWYSSTWLSSTNGLFVSGKSMQSLQKLNYIMIHDTCVKTRLKTMSAVIFRNTLQRPFFFTSKEHGYYSKWMQPSHSFVLHYDASSSWIFRKTEQYGKEIMYLAVMLLTLKVISTIYKARNPSDQLNPSRYFSPVKLWFSIKVIAT